MIDEMCPKCDARSVTLLDVGYLSGSIASVKMWTCLNRFCSIDGHSDPAKDRTRIDTSLYETALLGPFLGPTRHIPVSITVNPSWREV